nr:HU family DNA-binding protein [uncultured Bacteroides sp.]
MGERINIQNLIDLFAEKKGLSKKDAENFLKEFFALIEKALETDKYVKIKGFGTFKLIDVESRESVNVNTGERFQIQGHTKISFTPEASLRDQINKPFSHFETVILNEGVDFEGMSVTDEISDNEDEAGVSFEEENEISSNDVEYENLTSSIQSEEPEKVQATTTNAIEENTLSSENISSVNADNQKEAIVTEDEVLESSAEIDKEIVTSHEEVEINATEIQQEEPIDSKDISGLSKEVHEEESSIQAAEAVSDAAEENIEDEPVIAAVLEKIVPLKGKHEDVSIKAENAEIVEKPQAPATLAEFISQALEIKSKEKKATVSHNTEATKEDLIVKSKESLAVIPKEEPTPKEESAPKEVVVPREVPTSADKFVPKEVSAPKETHADKTEEESAPKQSGALIEELILKAKAEKVQQEAIASSQNSKMTIYYFVAMIAFLSVFAVAVFTYIYNPDFVMSMVPASSEKTAIDSTKVDSVSEKKEAAIPMPDTIPSTDKKDMGRLTDTETKNAEAEAKRAVAEAEKVLAESRKKDKEPVVAKESAKANEKAEATDSKEKKVLEKLNPNDYTIAGTKSTYTVKKGESLVRISQQFYNSKDLWTLILKHNQKVIKDEDNVPAGTVLKIPNLRSKK